MSIDGLKRSNDEKTIESSNKDQIKSTNTSQFKIIGLVLPNLILNEQQTANKLVNSTSLADDNSLKLVDRSTSKLSRNEKSVKQKKRKMMKNLETPISTITTITTTTIEIDNQEMKSTNKNNILKRSKRRGARIGSKGSSSGIGHGRTGARQDTASGVLTIKPFLIYNLILFLITIKMSHLSSQTDCS